MLICIALRFANIQVGPIHDMAIGVSQMNPTDYGIPSIKQNQVAQMPTQQTHQYPQVIQHESAMLIELIQSYQPFSSTTLMNYLKDYVAMGIDPSSTLDIKNENGHYPLDVAYLNNKIAAVDILIGFNFKFMTVSKNGKHPNWSKLIHLMIHQQSLFKTHHARHVIGDDPTPYWKLRWFQKSTLWTDEFKMGILEYAVLLNPYDYRYISTRHEFDPLELEHLLVFVKKIKKLKLSEGNNAIWSEIRDALIEKLKPLLQQELELVANQIESCKKSSKLKELKKKQQDLMHRLSLVSEPVKMYE
eukprot:NODE_167_length_14562_cov_0.357256.p6 type:complete len:302 gc:universal NODE_167_length_14562_cov_0.357256:8615-9520(+)